jgi:hypothetical protein
VPQKKTRVFPMFFSCTLSMRAARGVAGDARRGAATVAAAGAGRRRGEKKLRSGVDTLKNRD